MIVDSYFDTSLRGCKALGPITEPLFTVLLLVGIAVFAVAMFPFFLLGLALDLYRCRAGEV